MKKILHNKSLLHRLIALVMSVVMVLTLVAIDSKVHLFAEEEIKTVDITDLLKGDETDILVMIRRKNFQHQQMLQSTTALAQRKRLRMTTRCLSMRSTMWSTMMMERSKISSSWASSERSMTTRIRR